MKVIYVGCKPSMAAFGQVYTRGKGADVTSAIGGKLLKITGFVTSLNADSKKELESNVAREKREVKKLKSPVTVVTDDKRMNELIALNDELITKAAGNEAEMVDYISRLETAQSTIMTLTDELNLANTKVQVAEVMQGAETVPTPVTKTKG